MENTFNPSAIAANENLTLNKRLNSFYQSDVLPVIPEAHNIHPRLSTHQFRHTFAEFALRRFDEDIHERLREHFVHSSGYSTLIYERWKLSPAVQTMLEKDYLYELIGKTAAGKLEMRFWGPAYHRIKNMIEKINFAHPSNPEKHYWNIVSQVERFTAFEWGFCVLFCDSKHEARCHNQFTGLPDIDGESTAERCTGCPNNMGNSIQKENLIRTALAHSEIGRTHPIKAVGKICSDIAEQIIRRVEK